MWTLKMQQREPNIDSLLHETAHVSHPSFTVAAGQQSNIHFTSTPCIQKEMSDNEVRNEIQDGLGKANMLTMKDFKATTIARTIQSTIADSGASKTCVQPTEEQMQASECGQYTWDGPSNISNEKSDKIFQMARGDIASGKDSDKEQPRRTQSRD